MITRLNANMTNNKQQNFGTVNQKWLEQIRISPTGAYNGILNDTYTFNKNNKSIIQDLKDTIEEAFRLNYITGPNRIKSYREFVEKDLK